jgi:hypothetical protein
MNPTDDCETCENCRRLEGEIAVHHAETVVIREEIRQALEQTMAEGRDITPLLDKLQEDGYDTQSLLFG